MRFEWSSRPFLRGQDSTLFGRTVLYHQGLLRPRIEPQCNGFDCPLLCWGPFFVSDQNDLEPISIPVQMVVSTPFEHQCHVRTPPQQRAALPMSVKSHWGSICYIKNPIPVPMLVLSSIHGQSAARHYTEQG